MWFHQGPTEMLEAAQKLSCPEMCTHFANVIRRMRWTKTFFPKVSPNILYYFLGTKIPDCLLLSNPTNILKTIGSDWIISVSWHRWATLKAALVERRSKLGESKTIQQFSRDAEDIEAWVSEKLQTVLDESYKDPTNLQVWARQFHVERLLLNLRNAITE